MPVLQFKGKTAVENHHYTVPHHTLEFDKSLSVLGKGQKPSLEGNLIIEGDNLLALKALLPTHAGRIKCIYIDPPYNTGNEGWVYNDNLTQPQFKEWIGHTVGKEGEDFCRHDKWCCMMYPRLRLLKELLRPDGMILISIDDFEFHNLRSLMDEIFGIGNHIATLVWEKGRKNDARFFSVGHEYMVVFARSLEFLKSQGAIWRETKPGAFELWVEYSRLRDLNGQANGKIEAALREWHKGLHEKHPAKKLSRWLHVDEFGPWRDRDISWIGGGGPRYNVIHPKTKKPCKVPDRGWGFATPESMQRQIDLGLVEFREDHTKPPFLKRHLRPHVEELREDEEGEEEGMDGDEDIALQVMPSVIYKQSQTAVRYLRGLLGENVFENPKDYLVLSRLFNYCTGPDDLILDSFAGSGSAGQATLESNKRDNGHRRFILIQQTFDSKGDAEADRNICRTVTQPRLCKSAKQERYDLNFTYARLGPKLFGEYRDFGDQPPAYEELAKYVFYTETSHEFDRKALDSKTGRIGEHAGTAYYLLYAPSAKEDRALDLEWLKKVGAKEKCKKLVDYCEKLWAHRDELTVWEKQASKSLRTMLVPVNLK